ncbi:MAG TPA: TonB-dependent receptor, partial [Gammaproteobacteria bacterium]|nr:TonB-dependent receptor [Gammaproteobacteria bacterium]
MPRKRSRNCLTAPRGREAGLGGLTCLVLAATSSAQVGVPTELESITVTATRLPREAEIPSATTTLDTGTIALRNKTTVPELLADVAGLHASQPGGRGSVGELLLRGGEPNFTAVLVNGVEMNDPTNTRGGSFDFSTLDISEVQSIEITRGPLSSVYGSDALSGVINIVTHRPSDTPSSSATLTLGGKELARAGLRVGGPASAHSRYGLSVGTLRDGRHDDDGGYRSTTLSGTYELAPSAAESLTIDARHGETDLHAYPQSSGGPSYAVLRGRDRRRAQDSTLGVRWRQQVSPHAELHVRGAHLEHDEDIRSPGVAAGIGGAIPANSSRAEFTRDVLTLYLTGSPNARLSAAIGLDYEHQHGSSQGLIAAAPGVDLPASYDLTRSTSALFAELAYELSPALDLSAALRLDDSDAGGPESTGRLGASYALADRVRLRIAAAQGFKQPSLFSLGDPLVGNSSLVAETATSRELGVDLGAREDALTMEITVFRQRFEDLIDFDFETFTTVNRDSVDADGIELSARWRVADG